MSGKRLLWTGRKHWWHLSFGKARRLDRLFDQIELERVEPYKVELKRGKMADKR